MFPDALRFVVNRPSAGKVFGFEVESAGWGSRSGRSIQVDGEAWRHCLECPDFDHCYKLSMAKMALSAAIASQ
jgi:hypothetical protein